MLPKTILFDSFLPFIPKAHSPHPNSVECANNSCRKYAVKLYTHPHPEVAKCEEPLGTKDCQNERKKNYYQCGACGAITSKNKIIHRDDPREACSHRGKKIYSVPHKPPPSEAPSQPSTSAANTPSRMIGTKEYFYFLPEGPSS
jgi:hypothetical protein